MRIWWVTIFLFKLFVRTLSVTYPTSTWLIIFAKPVSKLCTPLHSVLGIIRTPSLLWYIIQELFPIVPIMWTVEFLRISSVALFWSSIHVQSEILFCLLFAVQWFRCRIKLKMGFKLPDFYGRIERSFCWYY